MTKRPHSGSTVHPRVVQFVLSGRSGWVGPLTEEGGLFYLTLSVLPPSSNSFLRSTSSVIKPLPSSSIMLPLSGISPFVFVG